MQLSARKLSTTSDNPYTTLAESTSKKRLTRTSYVFFLAFCAYIVIPVIDIPLLGLSISAPILFLVFLEVFFKIKPSLKQYRVWFIICYFFLFGLLASLVGNAVFRAVDIGTGDVLTLIRYGYWIIAFLTTTLILSAFELIGKVSTVIAVAVVALGALRLYEAIFFGRWGAWTSPQLISQNGYGILYSTFFPFALMVVISAKGRWKLITYSSVILLIVAVAGNGSRTSWIAVITGACLFLILYGITQKRGLVVVQSRLVFIIALIVFVVAAVPPDLLDPVISRFDTFEALDNDKSYQIRQLMIQKGLRLFEDSPIFGSGIGRFTSSSVPLDIPNILSYGQQDSFDRRSAHNSYISLIGETGISGVVPFVVLHLLLFVRGLSASVSLARRGIVWGLAVICSYVGMSLHLWSLSGLTGTAPWFVYGLVAGMIEYERRARDTVL